MYNNVLLASLKIPYIIQYDNKNKVISFSNFSLFSIKRYFQQINIL